ncbi:MAG: hypothetical protein HKN95_02225 [Acidimicrobiia bacterium]|nr:hypothetical protein [Acidimicrobiia bacterium]
MSEFTQGSNSIRTPLGEMWLTDDGVLVHRIDDGLTVTADDAAAVRKAVAELTGGRLVPAVVDMRAVGYAERAARHMFGAASEESFESATALIVGSSTSQTMAQAFLAMGPQRPIEIFTSEREAMEWARSQIQDATG